MFGNDYLGLQEDYMFDAHIFKHHKRFSKVHHSIKDYKCSGRSFTSRTEENIEELRQIV